MKQFIRIMANDIASEHFTKGECIAYGIIVPSVLVAVLVVGELIG